ncbi:hypothetical protein, partial [Aeromonas diversa]|uniref:hypothetical protein n=1 Tax=Aeromonas diversa TaxID=502790 RepID=UPI0039A25E1B
VMGIICAARIVYANTHRSGNDSEAPVVIKDYLKVTEILQIKYTNQEGKVKKFKPAVGHFANDTVYLDGKNIVDVAS